MATNEIRTKSDEARDALAALRDAEQELARWRQHIERTIAPVPGRRIEGEAEGFVFQALNSGHIVEASVAKALKHTGAMRSIQMAEASS